MEPFPEFKAWWLIPMAFCFTLMLLYIFSGKNGMFPFMYFKRGHRRPIDLNNPKAVEKAHEELKLRYVRGEISKEEYKDMKKELFGA